jgi:hypothetical protein
MSLQKNLKVALNENRLLILGTQVLFGFQFHGVFQELFAQLPTSSKIFEAAGLELLVLSIALLVAPSMLHRIGEGGRDSSEILVFTTGCAALALLPLALALALEVFVVTRQWRNESLGTLTGVAFFLVAVAFWYGLAFWMRKRKPPPPKPSRTSLDVQVDQLLTEARLIIPGSKPFWDFSSP